MDFEQQKALPLRYKDVSLDCGYRLDFLVSGNVIVELKSVHKLTPIHEAQMLSYLRIAGCPVGLLVNFNVQRLTDGIQRMVNNFPEA